MVFSSLTFLMFFLPLVMGLYFLRSNIRWRNGILLVSSLLFYGWSDPVWILAMLFSTFLNYVCALRIAKTKHSFIKRWYLFISMAGSLGLLFYFKYSAFTLNGLSALFGSDFRMDTPVLPIGISFYTFQVLSYTLDVYWEKTPVQKKPLRLLLYVSCFPQLIAGPIVRYDDIEQRLSKRYTSPDDFQAGMRRFVVGLSKKVLLANIAGAALNETVLAGSGTQLSFAGAWLSAFLYALQIYFDFSAYSDMAIGIGRVLGFEYKENFDYPYISRSAGEFWRRWHISLGTWFREYLMYPLMRSRIFRKMSMKKSPNRSKMYYRNKATIICTMIVWMCTGLWHGASLNFVVWGLYYGLMMVLEKFVFDKILAKTPGVIKWFFTMIVALVSFVIFYYTDFSHVSQHLLAMVGLRAGEGGFGVVRLIDDKTVEVFKTYAVFMVIACACCLPVGKWIRDLLGKTTVTDRTANGIGTLILSGLLVMSILFLVGQSFNPFIYFRF
ncbi:MAG: MBOAT family protein [Clostridia bacterium]|nr:MBOAT family protein [Clostridia bacterium]